LDLASKPCELRASAPGKQSSETPLDIDVIDAPAFCSLIEEGPLTFGIVMPSIESLITDKSSIPADVLDDDDILESLPDHIPSCYSDFANIFSGKNANKLSPRRPYNHSIELETGTTPYSPIYKQSETKLKAIKDFINEYLAKVFIRPSQSPAGAPIIFAKKKDGSL
jgi:hypothetical protein